MIEHLAASECIVCDANHRDRQLDNSELSTILPGFCSNYPHAGCHTDVAETWYRCKGPFRNCLLWIHGDMDCQRNVSEWTLFKTLLRGKNFTAIAKHYGVFRALLQLFPDWIIQIGLRVCLQEVNRTPENLRGPQSDQIW